MRVQSLGEPAPANLAEQRIRRDFRFYLGADVSHQPVEAVPALLAVRVVEQDQPPPGDIGVVPLDGRGDSRSVRRQPFRCWHVFELQILPGLSAGLHHGSEGGTATVWTIERQVT